MHNPEPVLENETRKILWAFKIQTNHLISARRLGLEIVNKKKGAYRIVDIALPADHRMKLKESEKRDKYQDIAQELNNMWNVKVTVIPIIIGALGTVTKRLIKRLDD